MLFQKPGKTLYTKKMTIQLNGELIHLDEPVVMGILNCTPDSFYDGGRYNSVGQALDRASLMVGDGAAILDLGAHSTRPGSEIVPVVEEIERLLPVAEAIRKEFPSIPISIDTFRSEVVQAVYDRIGDVIVNDVSGGQLDSTLFDKVAQLQLPYVLMHMQGTPQTMQSNPHYNDVVGEILHYLSERLNILHRAGVRDVIVDPGFGFGKNLDHNFEILNKLDAFRLLEVPLMVGLSRKSMIWRALNCDPAGSLNGTTALHVMALAGGANILRVHDVKEAVETIQLVARTKKCAL